MQNKSKGRKKRQLESDAVLLFLKKNVYSALNERQPETYFSVYETVQKKLSYSTHYEDITKGP